MRDLRRLVKRAQSGDADAFVQLIEENRQSLYKVAVCYVKNPEDAARNIIFLWEY